MTNLTICKVVNKLNEYNLEDLVILSEWEDTRLKVYVIKNNGVMICGEVMNNQLEKYAKTFSKTLDVYLQETRNILNGMDHGVDFFLTDSKFYWKRKKWSLGQVNVQVADSTENYTSFMLTLSVDYLKTKNKLDDIEKDYQNLRQMNNEIIQRLNELQNIKEQLEDGLYKKFALLLNSKKAKIRELKDELKKLEKGTNIFDDLTDESENEFECNSLSSHSGPNQFNKKRAHENNTNEKLSKKKKKSDEISIQTSEKSCSVKDVFVNVSDTVEPAPSTSSNTKNLDEDEETPDLLSGESECDLELKFDEEKLEDESKVKESAITEEDSEEMF